MNASRQLAAIMFTDMVGYTALMQQNEQIALQRRDSNQQIFDRALEKFRGKLLQYYGDGAMSMFSSAVNAILCSIEIQTLCRREKIDLRIGIHIGDVITDDKGIYGDSVNVASRIESLAVPGSIFISEKLFDDVKNHEGISAKAIGYFELKNVNQPIQVFAIANEGMVVPSREDVKGKIKQSLNAIAVLPFASMSSDPENEFFCDGITEELINVLAKVDGLQVTSRTSAFAFKGKNEDVREIATKLNVQKVLEGSVRKSGNKVRITAQLINAADGYHFWSETFDRNLEDIFEVQDEISRTISNKLRQNLSEASHEKQLVKAPTENLQAYMKYLQGIHHWNRQTIEDVMKALELFHEAVAIEPGFANPYFNIVYITAYFPYFGIMSTEEARSICTEAANKAMELDPGNARSHLAAGINALYFEWDMVKAEYHLSKAIELNPSLSEAYFIMGYFRMIMQQRDQIDEPLSKAYLLDPMGGETVPGIGEVNCLAGNLDKADAFCKEAIKNNPESLFANTMSALVTGCRGDWNKTIAGITPFSDSAPEVYLLRTFLGYACAKTGRPEKAKTMIDEFIEMEKKEGSPPLAALIALLYLALGDKEKFYYYFEEGMRAKMLFCLYFYNSPLLADVNGEERIINLRREYRLPV